MDDFTQLLEIRSRRFNKLKKIEEQKIKDYLDAINEEEKLKNSIVEFKDYVKSQELQLISDIINKEIYNNDIDKLNQKLQELEKEAANIKQKHIESKRAVEKCENAIKSAEFKRKKAEIKLNKLNEIVEHVSDENKKLQDHQNSLAEESAIDDINAYKFSLKK